MGRWSWPWGLMLAVVGSVEIGCRCAGDDPVANSGYGSVVDSRDFDLTAEDVSAFVDESRNVGLVESGDNCFAVAGEFY